MNGINFYLNCSMNKMYSVMLFKKNKLYYYILFIVSTFFCNSLSADYILQYTEDEIKEEQKILDRLNRSVDLNISYRYFPVNYSNLVSKLAANGHEKSVEYHYFLALDYYKKNNKAEALLELIQSLEIDPEFDLALNMMGLIYMEAGRYEEALEKFKKTTELNIYNPTYNYNYANALFVSGNFSEALKYADRVIELKSNVKEAFYLKGLLLLKAKNYVSAKEAFTSAHTNGLDTDDFIAVYLDTALNTKDEKIILELYRRISKLSEPKFVRLKARVQMKTGDYLAAAKQYSILFKSNEVDIEDKKNYLSSLIKSGNQNYDLKSFSVNEEELEVLKKIEKEISKEKTKSYPNATDPMLNPLQ